MVRPRFRLEVERPRPPGPLEGAVRFVALVDCSIGIRAAVDLDDEAGLRSEALVRVENPDRLEELETIMILAIWSRSWSESWSWSRLTAE